MSDVSESLILLKSNEQCEWIAHFAHQKWATMSDSLRSLRWNEQCERIVHFAHQKWANEWIAHFFERIAHSLIFGQKASDSLGNQMSEFPALSWMHTRMIKTEEKAKVVAFVMKFLAVLAVLRRTILNRMIWKKRTNLVYYSKSSKAKQVARQEI